MSNRYNFIHAQAFNEDEDISRLLDALILERGCVMATPTSPVQQAIQLHAPPLLIQHREPPPAQEMIRLSQVSTYPDRQSPLPVTGQNCSRSRGAQSNTDSDSDFSDVSDVSNISDDVEARPICEEFPGKLIVPNHKQTAPINFTRLVPVPAVEQRPPEVLYNVSSGCQTSITPKW